VRLLVDESISPRVAALLTAAGHEALHLGEVGLLGAPDELVMAASLETGRVLVSADTDFGDLLALGRHIGPSVVILRRALGSRRRKLHFSWRISP
jgi:predicted nuclease of predicted toxin-antitoxin system